MADLEFPAAWVDALARSRYERRFATRWEQAGGVNHREARAAAEADLAALAAVGALVTQDHDRQVRAQLAALTNARAEEYRRRHDAWPDAALRTHLDGAVQALLELAEDIAAGLGAGTAPADPPTEDEERFRPPSSGTTTWRTARHPAAGAAPQPAKEDTQ